MADADAGKAILKLAEDGKIDLIVMGAFGRSRFREWVLGGATRHVLEDMTVPVFMALNRCYGLSRKRAALRLAPTRQGRSDFL